MQTKLMTSIYQYKPNMINMWLPFRGKTQKVSSNKNMGPIKVYEKKNVLKKKLSTKVKVHN